MTEREKWERQVFGDLSDRTFTEPVTVEKDKDYDPYVIIRAGYKIPPVRAEAVELYNALMDQQKREAKKAAEQKASLERAEREKKKERERYEARDMFNAAMQHAGITINKSGREIR